MGTESSGGYTITFGKNTFLSLGVDVYGKSENLNEEKNEKSVQSTVYSFAYSFDDTFYESTTFDEKPTPVAMYQEKSILNLKAVIYGKAPS